MSEATVGDEPTDQIGPRISRRRAALTVVIGLTVAGVVVGSLWSWIAPPIRGAIALSKDGERVRAFLGHEADNFFTSPSLLVGMVVVVAIVTAVLVWQWRVHRGPLLVIALALGAVAAAGSAAGVGAALVRLRYGAIDMAHAPVSPEHRVHYVTAAAPVFLGHHPLLIVTTLLFPAAMAAVAYGICAVASPRDDLGGWPARESLAARPAPPDGGQIPAAHYGASLSATADGAGLSATADGAEPSYR